MVSEFHAVHRGEIGPLISKKGHTAGLVAGDNHLHVRLAPKATKLPRCREVSQSAKRRPEQVQQDAPEKAHQLTQSPRRRARAAWVVLLAQALERS
jgi:hypothetical protein